MCACAQSCPTLCDPWTVTHQALLSVEFPRQEYWSGLTFPTPGDLPDPGIKTATGASPLLADGFFTTSSTWQAPKVCVLVLSHVQLFASPWTVAHQAPLSVEFSRHKYWSGLPFTPPGHLLSPGIKLSSLASPALEGRFFITMSPGMPQASTV